MIGVIYIILLSNYRDFKETSARNTPLCPLDGAIAHLLKWDLIRVSLISNKLESTHVTSVACDHQ